MTDVFYIAYLKKGYGWGISAFYKFLESYEKYPAGLDNKLTVILRGYEDNPDDYKKIKNICEEKNISTLDTEDTGLDFGAYLEGAKVSTSEYIVCFNTTCEIVSDNWLKKLYSPIEKNNSYKMVGVNGSYELCPEYISELRLSKNKIKTVLERLNIIRILYRYLFTQKMKGFPNYHIRTSCFLINRKIFIEYFEKNALPQTKMKAYKIENGENSISKYILKNNYNICIVDKFGKIFEKEDFCKSNTYRAKIKNYIVKDRQIEFYENTNIFFQKYLKKISWGK